METPGGNLNSNYFLCRIKEFEKKYDMPWWEFFAIYQSSQELLPGYGGRDYSEWAFLCENFYAELSVIGDSPPCERTTESLGDQKPEISSGFCFEWGQRGRFGETLLRNRAGYH